jgi:hypothetical protein
MIPLKPNTGQDRVIVPRKNMFVFVTDFKKKFLLRQIYVGPGQHSWHWIPLQTAEEIDISDIGNRVCTFNNALNRAVNDPYCTVYMCDDFDDMVANWHLIVYQSGIQTVYTEEE